MENNEMCQDKSLVFVTAGSNYLDIDAYACMVAMAELMRSRGENAVAYSGAICNYSVCKSLIYEGQILRELLPDFKAEAASYIIVDVSDPGFLSNSVPLNQVIAVYDHHVGFEEYWTSRIGRGTHIEFIGAAATLIYREWKNAGLLDKMARSTVLLLIAAILDNTLNLTSSNTTLEDVEAFKALCQKENIGEEWCVAYFSEVQANVEADLENALRNDMKRIGENFILPANMMQLCVWDAGEMLKRLPDIRRWFYDMPDGWMLNLIDIKHRCSYFVCDDTVCQKKLEKLFCVSFEMGVAKSPHPYLRKQILKNVLNSK